MNLWNWTVTYGYSNLVTVMFSGSSFIVDNGRHRTEFFRAIGVQCMPFEIRSSIANRIHGELLCECFYH